LELSAKRLRLLALLLVAAGGNQLRVSNSFSFWEACRDLSARSLDQAWNFASIAVNSPKQVVNLYTPN
jgi:hypothetical protein